MQNVSLPSLIFAAVVTAFSKDNIASLGPLCMNAIIYQFVGLVRAPAHRCRERVMTNDSAN